MKKYLLLFTTLFVVNTYAKSNDEYNFTFSPIALLVGSINGEVTKKIHPHWTVGGSLSYLKWSINGDSATATGVSGEGIWYKNGVHTDGLYINPSLGLFSANVKTSTTSASGTGLYASGIVGYGWFWDSFNMRAGGGLAIPLGSAKIEYTDSNGKKESTDINSTTGLIALQYQIGWTF